jgi:hypothetical protein
LSVVTEGCIIDAVSEPVTNKGSSSTRDAQLLRQQEPIERNRWEIADLEKTREQS